VPNRSTTKGATAERQAAALVSELLGVPARRALGAGRLDDVGDVWGVPHCAIQVANWTDVVQALRIKPPAADIQAMNAGVPLSATFLRLRGGEFRVAMTVDMWAKYYREATA
jgi:hypothetical protein